ncbi:MAG: hypothetical protein ACHQE5_07085 [Actinomycetes bacterium]
MNASTPTDLPVPRARRAARQAAVVALVPLVVLLAACGSSGGSGTGAAGAPSSAPSAQRSGQAGQGGGFGGANFPGASGLIAAVEPGQLQVQSSDSQTTVTYTNATRFARTVAGKVADGQCVTVTGAPVSGSSDTLTATSVRIEAKVNGACPTATGRTGGFGGGQGGGNGGQGGQGFQGGTGAPRPSGAPSGQFRDLAFATGTVSTVSGSTVTVQGVLREGRPTSSPASPASTPGTSGAPSTITVVLASTTTVTETVPATKAAAVVGVCATAIGKADDRGDIAATSITITKPDANGCRAGFGGFGGFGRGGTGTGATPGSGTSA